MPNCASTANLEVSKCFPGLPESGKSLPLACHWVRRLAYSRGCHTMSPGPGPLGARSSRPQSPRGLFLSGAFLSLPPPALGECGHGGLGEVSCCRLTATARSVSSGALSDGLECP